MLQLRHECLRSLNCRFAESTRRLARHAASAGVAGVPCQRPRVPVQDGAGAVRRGQPGKLAKAEG